MAQVLFKDKITTISHSLGVVSLAAGARLTIGGQQYTTSSILQVSLTGLVASTLYFIYAVASGGSVSLVQSTNINSLGPAGHSSWKLVGALYTDSVAAFQSFVGQQHTSPYVRTLSGSGTYTTPLYSPWIEVEMSGSGGGGGGGGAGGGGTGGTGTATTFGSFSAGPGGGGGSQGRGGDGGTNTFTPGIDISGISLQGGDGGSASSNQNSGSTASGGNGGQNPIANGGAGSVSGQAATAGRFGGGGGGGSASGADADGGGGGGAGGYIKAKIQNPASSYSFACGTAGAAGAAGGGGGGSSAGSNGTIVVVEGRPSLEQLETL